MRKELAKATRVVFASGLALLGAGAALAQTGASPRVTEGPPLPSVGAQAAAARQGMTRQGMTQQGMARGAGSSRATRSPSGQAPGSTHVRRKCRRWPPRPKVDKAFDALGFDDNLEENDLSLFIPANPIGAAGPSRLVAVVSSMIEARTRGGALKWRAGLLDFFAPLAPRDYPFDPKVVYDHRARRFVVVALELVLGTPENPENVSRILLAVSKNRSPRGPGDWYFHAIDARTPVSTPETWADYPGLEVDEEAVYITTNVYGFPPPGAYYGVRLWIVDKVGFYDGGAVSANSYNPYEAGGLATTTMPAEVHGRCWTRGRRSRLGTYLVSYSGLSNGLDELLQVVTVEDPLGRHGGPFFSQEYVVVGDIEDFSQLFLPDAPQRGSPFPIGVTDRRVLDAVWRDGRLWAVATIVPAVGPDAGQTTAHWFSVDTQGGPGALVLDDQGDIGGEDIARGTFTFFPSVAVNRRGDAAFGFSASGPTIYAGAYVTGRKEFDAAGTVRRSRLVRPGMGPYKRFFQGARNRWGGYSGISVDPANQRFFWIFNQWADTPGTPGYGTYGPEDGRWGTAWGRFRF